jgi:hypothetical protein
VRLVLSRKTWLILLLAAVIAAGAIGGARLYRVALLGSGFMAEILCAGVFVSHRDPLDVQAEDLAGPARCLTERVKPS